MGEGFSMAVLIFLLLFFCPQILPADPVDDILEQVDEAVADESYTRAISLLETAKSDYPGDARLPARAGRLYRDRELYNLALSEFRNAESLDPGNAPLLLDIAETLGYLGENAKAAETLEKLLILDDADTRSRAIDDLSWMYFKTFRLNEGVSLLEKELEEEFNRNWAHTLGTLYAGLYNLEESRIWYLISIEDALDNGDEFFASVAYYNLALLEFSFYRYEAAREMAERSMELRSRAGGFLVLGDLDFMNWNLQDALESYRSAESQDETPLSRVDLAAFYQRIGYLAESMRYVSEASRDPDESWMYHYGLDSVRFSMDLNTILADTWKSRVEVDRLTPKKGMAVRGIIRRLSWRLRGLYHDRLNRALTSDYAGELHREGNELDAVWNFSIAAGGYPAARRFLETARTLETALTSRAAPWYDLETGLEEDNPLLLLSAINGFTAEEKDPYEQALRGLSGRAGRRLPAETRVRYTEELYGMNPGGLRQYGLSLPISINPAAGIPRAAARRIIRLLRRTGYQVRRSSGGSSVLTVTPSRDGRFNWYFSGPDGQTRASAETAGVRRRADLAPVLASLLDDFYTTRPEQTAATHQLEDDG
jgi:tetratricopeptide (TPR) repeat protein